MDIFQLSEILHQNVACLRFLRANNLIYTDYWCTNCNRSWCWQKRDRNKEGYIWRCLACKKEKSIKADSFFSGSNLTCRIIVCVINYFCADLQVTQTHKLLKPHISEKSIIQWYAFCRDVCSSYLLDNPIRIGGPGLTVEVDETKLCGRRKYGRGRLVGVDDDDWLVGLIDRTTKRGVYEIFQQRTIATLIPFIQRVVVPGTHINSDGWAAYGQVVNHGYTHSTVIHERDFVDPIDGTHTNGIEGHWGNLKQRFKRMHGTDLHNRPNHVDEALYRHNRGLGLAKGESIFLRFINDLRSVYPLRQVIPPNAGPPPQLIY